ncbi:MAG: purine-nucleoside phosphorylase [Candidatus Ornithomonoglobus sp.]
MFLYSDYEEAAETVRKRTEYRPKTLVVLGSGMSGLFDEGTEIPYSEIPHFPKATAPSHKGVMLVTEKAYIMRGRFHYYEGYSFDEITFYIRVMKLLGVRRIILTNAAGGVNPSYRAGDIAVISDHIKLSTDNPLRGANDDRWGTRFPDMTEAYSERLRNTAHECAAENGIELKDGVYFYMSGPQYETPAEIRAIAALGGDLVGMSTVFECIAARHCGLEVLGLSCITNLAAGISDKPLSEEEVARTMDKNKEKLYILLNSIIERTAEND